MAAIHLQTGFRLARPQGNSTRTKGGQLRLRGPPALSERSLTPPWVTSRSSCHGSAERSGFRAGVLQGPGPPGERKSGAMAGQSDLEFGQDSEMRKTGQRGGPKGTSVGRLVSYRRTFYLNFLNCWDYRCVPSHTA